MKTWPVRSKLKIFALLLILLAVLLPATASAASDPANTVMVIPIDGEITPAMAAFLEDKIDEANDSGMLGIIIDIKTFGGRVDAAVEMRDAILSSEVPVVVYIQSRAISAGALISIAADTIAMAPGSHLGAAKPNPSDSKTVAYVSGEFRTTAERTGRDPQIAAAMVDESLAIEGLVGEGEILDMTAEEASQVGYADLLVNSRNDLLTKLGWQNAVLVEDEPDFRLRIAQFLTSTEVAALLLAIGTLAFVVEFFTEGFGGAGIVGIVFFVLYFSGGFIAGYTNLWSIVIFIAGAVLIVVELIVPGFGVFGIAGALAMMVGIVLAAPSLSQGILYLLIAIVVAVVAVPLFIKFFGHSRFVRRLVLEQAETSEAGYVNLPESKKNLLGQLGVAYTDLRPAGAIKIDGRRIDVIAAGEFIDQGTPVKVIHVEGAKVIVEPVDE